MQEIVGEREEEGEGGPRSDDGGGLGSDAGGLGGPRSDDLGGLGSDAGGLGSPRSGRGLRSLLPSSVERRRGKRRRARRLEISRFMAVVGGLYLLSGIAGNGWLLGSLLRFPFDRLQPTARMALIFLPFIIIWFALSGIALFRGMRYSSKAVTYTAAGMGALCIAFLRVLPGVQLPATVLAFFNLVLLCLLVDFRFKSDFQRIERHHHRKRKKETRE